MNSCNLAGAFHLISFQHLSLSNCAENHTGFLSSEEAMHVADITEKLANFVIETDTEASIAPTDTGWLMVLYLHIRYFPFLNKVARYPENKTISLVLQIHSFLACGNQLFNILQYSKSVSKKRKNQHAQTGDMRNIIENVFFS